MFCPKCGTKNPDDAGFCIKCGSPLKKPASTNPENAVPQTSRPADRTAGMTGFPGKQTPVRHKVQKSIIILALAVLVVAGAAVAVKSFTGKKDSQPDRQITSGETVPDGNDVRGEGIEIKNDVHAAYFHDFVNLIPSHADIPYIEISGDNLHPDIQYNWLTMEISSDGVVYPYKRLRDAYSHALLDLYALNGKTDKALEMLQYFDCKNTITNWDGEALDDETQNEYDGLLWYLTFLNYHADVETQEDDYGTLVHVKISNTDMIPLLYEELEKVYEIVEADNVQAAADRITGAFNTVTDYINDEAINKSTVDHYEFAVPNPHTIVVYPEYGNSLISKLNLAELAGGLIFEQAKYQQNQNYWAELSDDGVLYATALGNMLDRMIKGDYDTINTEVTFYAEVDHRGIGYIPFDRRVTGSSFTVADTHWDTDTFLQYLQEKGVAGSNAGWDNFQAEDHNYSLSANSKHDYEDMLFWLVMGWRGRVVEGEKVAEIPDSIGYTGQVEEVTPESDRAEPASREAIYGESVMADVDPSSGYYVANNVLYELGDSEATLVGTTDDFDEVDFTPPSEINGRILTTIGEFAIIECSSLKSVVIPDTVTVIERSGISDNANLVSISLPETLTELGSGAFCGNSSLQEINIPAGITKIPDYCFMTCTGMKEFTVPDTVREIGVQAFDACYELHITVPKTVKSGRSAFGSIGAEVAELITY